DLPSFPTRRSSDLKTFDVDGTGRDGLVRGQADGALDPGGGQVLAQERLQLGGGVGQRGTDGARGQTEQVQHGLDGDDPLSAEDTGVHRGQPAVYGQRLGDLARVEGVDHLLEVAADDVADNTHKTRAPHRQHRQVEDVG